MTWTTIYTDGEIFGNSDFISNYSHPNALKYETIEAKITESTMEDGWTHLTFKVPGGNARLAIRNNIRSTLYDILREPRCNTLVGKTVQGYLHERQLMGFKKLEE